MYANGKVGDVIVIIDKLFDEDKLTIGKQYVIESIKDDLEDYFVVGDTGEPQDVSPIECEFVGTSKSDIELAIDRIQERLDEVDEQLVKLSKEEDELAYQMRTLLEAQRIIEGGNVHE
jgi:mevalonate kinase